MVSSKWLKILYCAALGLEAHVLTLAHVSSVEWGTDTCAAAVNTSSVIHTGTCT